MRQSFYPSLWHKPPLMKGSASHAQIHPREKLSKKARQSLDAEKRATWGLSPVTRKAENKKRYNRKKSAHVWKDDFGMSSFLRFGVIPR